MHFCIIAWLMADGCWLTAADDSWPMADFAVE
jgi:hypothetical protein